MMSDPCFVYRRCISRTWKFCACRGSSASTTRRRTRSRRIWWAHRYACGPPGCATRWQCGTSHLGTPPPSLTGAAAGTPAWMQGFAGHRRSHPGTPTPSSVPLQVRLPGHHRSSRAISHVGPASPLRRRWWWGRTTGT